MAYSYTGSAVTGQIQGDNRDYMDLVAIVNGRNSGHTMYIRRLMAQLDCASIVAASTTIFIPILTYRGVGDPAQAAFVTTAEKCPFISSESSDTQIKIYYPATGGGVNDSSLVGSASAGIAWRNWSSKLRSGAEQCIGNDTNQLPVLVQTTNFILTPGEYLFVRADPVALDDNNSGMGWFSNIVWQEEAIAMHAISGVVSLSGTGVVGAEVVVLVADDTALTNAVLWGVYTTTAGGAWTTPADIPDGKIAYAYASDYATSTYYTATGAPFVS
jgi:hypothetical protein